MLHTYHSAQPNTSLLHPTKNVHVVLNYNKLMPTYWLGMCMCLKSVGTERKILLAGYENGDIILWDLESSKIISQLSVHMEPGRSPEHCIPFFVDMVNL